MFSQESGRSIPSPEPIVPKMKRWFNLAQITGKGAESSLANHSNEFPLQASEEELSSNCSRLLMLNAVERIILPADTDNFLKTHIRKSMKIAFEVMNGEDHLIGFIEAEELLHVGRKRKSAVVPLVRFDRLTLMNKCGYESVFFKPKTAAKAKSTRKGGLNKKATESSMSEVDVEAQEIPYLNGDCQPVFVVVDLELEKPLNEEVWEDSRGMLEVLADPEVGIAHLNFTEIIPKVKADHLEENFEIEQPQKLEILKKNLLMVTRNIFEIYDREPEVNKIVQRMLRDGYFDQVENQLLPDICAFQALSVHSTALSAIDDFDEFRADLWCKMTSDVLNKNCEDETDQKLLAQMLSMLGECEKANEIYLRGIQQKNDETSWVDYAIHNLRQEKLSRASVCADKAISCNAISLIAHFVKVYISFRLQKFAECKRLISFMQFKHGNLMELSMAQYLVDIKTGLEERSFKIKTESFISHPQIDSIYEAKDIFEIHDKNLLSLQDPFIKSVTFFIKLGTFDLAELALSEYYATHGVNVNYSYLLAVIDGKKGKFSHALTHLSKIPSDDIGNHQLNYNKITDMKSIMELSGNIKKMMHTGNHPPDDSKSLETIKKFCSNFPSQLSFVELGLCFMKLGQLKAAEKCFHHTIAFDPNSAEAWKNLKDIYMKQNRTELVNLCMKNSNCI